MASQVNPIQGKPLRFEIRFKAAKALANQKSSSQNHYAQYGNVTIHGLSPMTLL
jgi:hypothetical protein